MTLSEGAPVLPGPLSATAPSYRTGSVQLPLCSLHVLESGEGPPLIVVPATLSELENWRELIQFMGQWFHSYFFELPGHGGSTPFAGKFSSERVAEAVRQLVDELGIARFNLMGFSFGGILAMKSFGLLKERIDRVVLLAPCLTRRAILLSPAQRLAATQLNRLMKLDSVRESLRRMMRSPRGSMAMARLVHMIGRVENLPALAQKLQQLRPTVLEVVSYEIDEILNIEFPKPAVKFETPCFFAMSIYDPLLRYTTTLDTLREHFARVEVTQLYYPFHQPPQPFTFAELNEAFGHTVQQFLQIAPAASTGGAAGRGTIAGTLTEDRPSPA